MRGRFKLRASFEDVPGSTAHIASFVYWRLRAQRFLFGTSLASPNGMKPPRPTIGFWAVSALFAICQLSANSASAAATPGRQLEAVIKEQVPFKLIGMQKNCPSYLSLSEDTSPAEADVDDNFIITPSSPVGNIAGPYDVFVFGYRHSAPLNQIVTRRLISLGMREYLAERQIETHNSLAVDSSIYSPLENVSNVKRSRLEFSASTSTIRLRSSGTGFGNIDCSYRP